MPLMTYSEHAEHKVFFLKHLQQKKAMMNLVETLQTPQERKVLLYLRNRGRASSLGDIQHKCRLQEQDVRTILAILINKGLVRRVDGGMFQSP
jgi:DNA-binding MarR family transcriptional regulator